MRVAYADPPYPGQARPRYSNVTDVDGVTWAGEEVDLADLAERLASGEFDGWCLHTSSPALFKVQSALAEAGLMPDDARADARGDYRVMAWVKTFAAFKPNIPIAYAWEPVLVKAARKPVVKDWMIYRDWHGCRMAMQKGVPGAKPESLCRWLFEVMGCEPDDELVDLYKGSGAVTEAWERWRVQLPLLEVAWQ